MSEGGPSMEKEEIIEKFSEFLRDNYYNDMISAISESAKSITVDFNLLDQFDPELADYLLENPEEVLPLAEESVKQIDLPGEPKLKIRIFKLPEEKQIRIRNVRAEHIGKLISIDGIVRRASEVRPEVSEAIFQCPECGNKLTVIQSERAVKPPFECDKCENRKDFKIVDQKLFDARWTAVEEPFEITTGERPSEIMIFLKEDLTSPRMRNKTDPGNRIKVVGVLRSLARRLKGSQSRQMEIFVDANSVEALEIEWEELDIRSEDEKKIIEIARDPEIYNKLVGSIAPALYGLEEIKEAIVLQLFSGEVHIQKDKSRVRGDINILLIGDPSCLVADERVIMSDGTVMKIGEMGSEHLERIDYSVHMGMGQKSGKAKIFHVYKKQPIMEIVTETGKSIRGTLNQPILIIKNMEKSWKRLDEVGIGDKVQVLPKIACRKTALIETNWKDPTYYHKSWYIKVPKFCTEDLAALFGYIIADGWVRERRVEFVINKNEIDILPKIKNIFEKCFDVCVNTYKHIRASPQVGYYNVDSTHVANLLSFLNEKRVPDLIWRSRDSVVASFLRWLYEGDGSVFSKGRGRLSVSLKSNNIELLRDVQLLLLRFGIHSRILWEEKGKTVKIKGREVKSSPSGSLMIRRSESVIKFWKNIGFVSKKKNDKLKQAVEYSRRHIRRIHKSLTEKIVQINKLSPQDVFDIEVPKYHRFVANGIVVHNTAKSVLMKVVSMLIPRGRYVSGKGVSVDYDDPVVFMEDGIIKTDLIGRVMDKFYKKNEDGFAKASNILVPSFDPRTLKIEWSPVRSVFRHKINEDLIKIKLRTGREVKVTSDHSVFAIESENGIVAKKVDEIKEGDFILIPNRLPSNQTPITEINLYEELKKIPIEERKYIETDDKYLKSKFSSHKIPIKIKIDDKIMRLIGYYIADGWLHETKKDSWKIEFELDSSDKKTIKDIKKIVHSVFNVKANERKRRDSKSCRISIDDKIIFLLFKYVLKVGTSAETKKIPDIVFNVLSEMQKEFIKGLVNGDYGVTISKTLISDLLYLFLFNGTIASFGTRKKEGVINFPGHKSYIDRDVFELKSPKPMKILSNILQNSKLHSRIPIQIFKGFGIDLSKSGYSRISSNAYKLLFSRNRKMIFERLKIMKDEIDTKTMSRIVGRNVKSTRQYLNSLVKKGFVEKNIINSRNVYKISFLGKKFVSALDLIEKLKNSDLGFVQVEKVKKEKPTQNYVYDFCVDGKENFVAGFGGVCCHNTGAGLTAAVIRDEEFMGGWVLEAGALVMCNRSLIAIDEFEKIEKTDQVALHEAMELNTISIAKANIIATLPAQTAILGGGNPKMGRFDPYVPIKEQIDIPETLMTRFDLKFALRDLPDSVADEKIAEHILQARHFQEIEIKPVIEADLLKKYISYARKKCHPKLSKEAGDTIKSFYVDLRKRTSEEAPVSITLRQYEALIRLAEAAAKVQLRDTVTKEDAIRAINLMKASLRQFGFDAETGMIDIDRAEGGVSATERSRIRIVLDVIDELEKALGKNIPKEEIVRRAKEQGVDAFSIEKILNELKNKGDIFEPKSGILQKM